MNNSRQKRKSRTGFGAARTLPAFLLATLLCTACANPFRASSIKLQKTEGTVNVQDQKGTALAPAEEMNLYSGYHVNTKKTSYAWMDLDQERLTKLDAESKAQIEKSGDRLEITLHSGNLFFNIATPLEDNESLDIRTSSMMVGIRGTCGWVELDDNDQMSVYILEGKVKCTISDPETSATFSASVSGGEKGKLVIADGEPDILVDNLTVGEIPDFVMEELENDDELCDRILEDSGLDVRNPPEDNPPEDNPPDDGTDTAPSEDDEIPPRTVPESVVYYGDRSQCRITPEMAGAFASEIRSTMDSLAAEMEETPSQFIEGQYPICGYAALFDTGNGIPAVIFGGGSPFMEPREDGANFGYVMDHIVWSYADGQVYALRFGNPFRLYPGYLLDGGHFVADPGYQANVYLLENGILPSSVPDTTASMTEEWINGQSIRSCFIDGAAVSEEQFEQWVARWNPISYLAGYAYGSDPASTNSGLGPVENVLELLDSWAEN